MVASVSVEMEDTPLIRLQKFLKKFLDVVIGLGGRFKAVTLPRLGEEIDLVSGHLSRRFVALVTDQYDRKVVFGVAFDVAYLRVDRLQLLQRLSVGQRIYEDEGVAFRYRQPLHGGKLMTSGRVCYLQRIDLEKYYNTTCTIQSNIYTFGML